MFSPASTMQITQLRSSLVGFCDFIYHNRIKILLLADTFFNSQWPSKQILISDYYQNSSIQKGNWNGVTMIYDRWNNTEAPPNKPPTFH